jgi:hypothetical protein
VTENIQYGFWLTMIQEGATFVHDPRDRGGPTKMGLTLGLMKNLGLDMNNDGRVTTEDVHLVTEDVVLDVYRAEFWNRVNGDKLPQGRDVQTADFAFNAGPGRARLFYSQTDSVDAFALRQMKYYLDLADTLPGYVGFFRGLTRRALQVLRGITALVDDYSPGPRIVQLRAILSEADRDTSYRGVFREKAREVLHG